MRTIPDTVKDDDRLTVREAAELLGLTPSGFKHHVYRARRTKVKRKAGQVTITGRELRKLAATPLASGIHPANAKTVMPIDERRRRLLKMRDQGATLETIRVALGYSDITAVSRAIRRAQRIALVPDQAVSTLTRDPDD